MFHWCSPYVLGIRWFLWCARHHFLYSVSALGGQIPTNWSDLGFTGTEWYWYDWRCRWTGDVDVNVFKQNYWSYLLNISTENVCPTVSISMAPPTPQSHRTADTLTTKAQLWLELVRYKVILAAFCGQKDKGGVEQPAEVFTSWRAYQSSSRCTAELLDSVPHKHMYFQ